MPEFRLRVHSKIPGKQVVEVVEAGKVIATIVDPGSTELPTIEIISAHMTGVAHADNRQYVPPMPSVQIIFSPHPYKIVDDQIIRNKR